jgi:hypothetical protein
VRGCPTFVSAEYLAPISPPQSRHGRGGGHNRRASPGVMPAEDCHSCPLRDFARGRQHLSGCGVSTAAASAAVTECVGFRAAYAQVPGFISERSVEFPAGQGTADAASAAGPHPKADGDSHRSQPRAPRVATVLFWNVPPGLFECAAVLGSVKDKPSRARKSASLTAPARVSGMILWAGTKQGR